MCQKDKQPNQRVKKTTERQQRVLNTARNPTPGGGIHSSYKMLSESKKEISVMLVFTL